MGEKNYIYIIKEKEEETWPQMGGGGAYTVFRYM